MDELLICTISIVILIGAIASICASVIAIVVIVLVIRLDVFSISLYFNIGRHTGRAQIHTGHCLLVEGGRFNAVQRKISDRFRANALKVNMTTMNL